MRRAWIVVVLAVASLVAALVTGRELYFRLAYLLAVLLATAGLWAWSGVRGLRLIRQTRDRHAQVGRTLEERFLLENTASLPKLWVVVRDHSDFPGHRASRVIHSLGAHQGYEWSTRTLCQRRGRYRLGPLQISSSDPLGLFEFRRDVAQTGSVVVYPATVPLRGFPQPRSYLPGGYALRRRTHQITTNAAGVRDYVFGDSFNRIHWPSTARHGDLVVKEFELDPLLDVWILIDMQQSVQVSERQSEVEAATREMRPLWALVDQLQLEPSTEEYVVTLAASVAAHFIRRRRSVGLVAYGQHREFIQADRDERQLGKVLETLAGLRAEGAMPFSQVLSTETRGMTRGVTVVTITPSALTEWADAALLVDRSGLRVVSLLVDAESFGGQRGARGLHERLLAGGIPAALIRNRDSLKDVLDALPQQGQAPPLPLVYAAP